MHDGERIILPLKGMDDGPNPQPGWAERIENLTIGADGTWRNCTDWAGLWTEADSASEPPSGATVEYQSIYWWGQRGTARQWLVWERGTGAASCALEVFDGIAKTYQVLATGRQRFQTPNPGTTYLPIGGWLYILNGYDQPVRWNGRWPNYGSELTRVGFDVPPPPPSLKVGAEHTSISTFMPPAGVGVASATWRYGYALTWVNDVGSESPPSETVYVTGTNGAALLLKCANIAWGTPPAHAKAVRIYRTVNLATAPATAEGARFSLYHVVDLPTAQGQVWDDGLPDQLLGHELDADGTGVFPTGARYAAYFKGTLFLAGAPSYPDRVFYSAPGLIEQFPVANTFDFGTGTGGEITGIHATQNALIVFRRRGVYLVKGDPINGFYAETVSEEVGCIAPGAIADVPSGVLFFSTEGPQVLRGSMQDGSAETEIVDLAANIRRLWSSEIDVGAMLSARCVRYEKDQEILFVLPSRSAYNTSSGQITLVYHYRWGYWSLRENRASATLTTRRISAMCRIDDHRGLVVMAGRTVYVSSGRLITGGTKGGSASIGWMYRMGWWGPRWSRVTVARLEILGSLSSDGTGGIGLRFAQDRNPYAPPIAYTATWTAITTFSEQRPAGTATEAIETEYAVDTWDVNLWDTGYWLRPQTRVYPIEVGQAGYEHQFEIAGGGPNVGPVELTAIAVWTVGGPEQAKWSATLGGARP